jgi:monofunctional biosynthetic peptidoglycan transglycosylase
MKLEPAKIGWQVVNDDVMGGCSRASHEVDPRAGSLHFRGMLSVENNGGFASVRGELDAPLPPFSAVRVLVSGDGRQYQLRLRETSQPEDIAWRARFRARDAREAILLPLDDFEPVFRGRRVEALPGLAYRKIRFLGFMLTSQQPGAFALTVHQISTVDRDVPAR